MFTTIKEFFRSAVTVLFSLLKISNSQSYPEPLTPEEEYRLFKELKANPNNEELVKKIAEHNLRLCSHMVKKYCTTYTPSQDREDFESDAHIGLMKAVVTFDPDKNFKFATYAATCIENEIKMDLRDQKKRIYDVSMSDASASDKDDNEKSVEEGIGEGDENTMTDDLDKKENIRKALDCLQYLDPEERKIVIAHFGLGNTKRKKERETAEELGISRSFVSRKLTAALAKLKKYMGQS